MALSPFQIGEQCRKLEQRLVSMLPCAVQVVPTRSAHTWVSYRMLGKERIEIRLTPALLDAPPKVLRSLIDWIYRRGDRGQVLDEYFESIREQWREYLPPLRIRTEGAHHDLAEILTDVRSRHFQEVPVDPRDHRPVAPAEELEITWGRRAPSRSGAARQRVLRLGSWDSNLRLIRIHPNLDRPDVPRRFIEFIVYHELLHAAIPPIRDRAGRRLHHHRTFREFERRHPDHQWAETWEGENITRLLKPYEGATRRNSRQPGLFP